MTLIFNNGSSFHSLYFRGLFLGRRNLPISLNLSARSSAALSGKKERTVTIFKQIGSLILLSSMSVISYGSAWKTLAPGFEYQTLKSDLSPWSHIHVFRIQPETNRLLLSRAKDQGLQQAFVKELVDEDVKLAVNGGFFDNHFNPLGLRIHEGKKLNPIKPISWWGVFSIKNGEARIERASSFEEEGVDFAIQSGPRLIIDGHIPSLKPGRDERTAIGINKKGAIIIVVTEHALLTTSELAKIMRHAPIFAVNALNLDGGSSTQVYANLPGLKLDLHGFAMVADAVVVK